MSATASCSAESARPVRAAKTAALAAIHAMCARKRKAPASASATQAIPVISALHAEATQATTAQATPVVKPPLTIHLKKEFLFPRPNGFTTTKEFYERVRHAHAQSKSFHDHLVWDDTRYNDYTPRGAIELSGNWWDEADHEWEHGWTAELRKSKHQYRLVIRARPYLPVHPAFWKEMTEEVVPYLNRFLQPL